MVIGDLHFHLNPKFDLPDGSNFLLDRQEATLRWIFEEAERRKAKTMVMLGDIHTSKDRLPNAVKNSLLSVMEDYKEIRKIIVCGNHDANGEAIRYLAPYCEIIGVNHRMELGGWKCLMVPYSKHSDTQEEFLQELGGDVVLGHFFVEGCQPPGQVYIKRSTLKVYDLAFYGHRHLPSPINDGSSILCLGSIYQEDFAEAGQDKIACTFPDGVELIKIPQFIERRRIDVKDGILTKRYSEYDDSGKRRIYRIDVSGNTELEFVDKVRKQLEEAGHFVFVEVMPREFAGKELVHSNSRKEEVMEEFFKGILKGQGTGDRYFMKRVIAQVEKKVKEEK